MDEREVDLLPNCNESMEDLIHELLSDEHGPCCTYVHTCNPSGPDNSHTHTCLHVHTKLITPNETNDDLAESTETRPMKMKMKMKGNREAVRKYREKKKARAASFKDEDLLQRLRAQPALQAEVVRLKCLLVDLRARIHGEISSFFHYQTTCVDVADPGSYVMNPCDAAVHCVNGVDPEKQ